jgi:hypothetical protein
MVASGTAGAVSTDQAAPADGGGVVPFFYGSNLYAQKFGTPDPFQLGAAAQEFTYNVVPGGFLRGVRLQMRSAGGVLGAGVLNADAPWSAYSSIKLENVDGSEIMKPMGGYAYYASQRFFRPWHGDPAKRHDYSATVNPAGTLLVQPEIRQTAGVLANTDARSQYRITYSLAASNKVFSTAPTTAPTVSVTKFAEIWAQPDAADAHGNTIEALPPGLNLATARRHQILPLNAAGAENILQLGLTGNEIRGLLLIVRDSLGARQDYLGDPIRWNIDNRNLGVFNPDEVFDRMEDFYDQLSNGSSTRPTGVYAFPRFFLPGDLKGEAWLGTTNATYMTWETTTPGAAVNLPGTVEVIADEVIPVGAVPMELESI